MALSSGRAPSAIGVVRVSGPQARVAATGLAGPLPTPRRVSLRALRDPDGALLDRALVLVFPGPRSATGEDLIELHCHGGRAVVTAVIETLIATPGVRHAEPGEFTRRALLNGRIDLAQAQGLADLLEAETEAQRRAALTASEGRLSGVVRDWLARLAMLSAQVEATLDYAEDGDVAAEASILELVRSDAAELRREIERALAAPPVERLKDGVRVVIGGPPNSGKSTLLNLLAEREAAIVSPYKGTTRDLIEAPLVRNGVAYLFADTAGLNDAIDEIERIGVARAKASIAAADLLLWLGDDLPPRKDAIWVHARADLPGRGVRPAGPTVTLRQDEPLSVAAVWEEVDRRARALLPLPDDLPFKAGQRAACETVVENLELGDDPLLSAERLRVATKTLSSLLGLDASGQVLDALFGRFCLGK